MPPQELSGIEGFEESVAAELQERARVFLEEQAARAEAKRKELGVGDDVAAIEGMTPARLVVLGEKGIKTLDDLGDLAADELNEMLPATLKLDADDANRVIMAARR